MNKELVGQAASCLKILQVALRSTEVKIDEDYDPLYGSNDLSYQLRTHLAQVMGFDVQESGNKNHVIRFLIETGIRLIESQGDSVEDSENDSRKDPKVVAEIVARHALYYSCQMDKIPSKESIQEFGQFNAAFQVWPYWREYVQSVFARTQLPVFALPMFQLNGDVSVNGLAEIKEVVEKRFD